MYSRFLAVLALTFAVSACEAETSPSTATADAATNSDAAGGSDTAKADTAAADAADAAAGETAGADTAGTDGAGSDTAEADTVVTGAFAPAGAALAAKCASCHTTMPQAKFDGKDCAVAATFSKKIQGQINGAKMPPYGSPALTADESAAIAAWVTAGAKCN